MDIILQQIADWLKAFLVDGIMDNLTGLFDAVNRQVGDVAGEVGTSPLDFSPGVFSMIRSVSESVIVPIAGMILTFIACYELIQMVIDHNNLNNFETWFLFKWVFKTFIAVTLVSNTFDITMAVFDVAQYVVNQSAGLVAGDTAIDASVLADMRADIEALELGPLLGLYLQTFVVQLTTYALSIIIFIIIYGRMIEIYLMTSLAPIPFATFGNREQSANGAYSLLLTVIRVFSDGGYSHSFLYLISWNFIFRIRSQRFNSSLALAIAESNCCNCFSVF